MSKKCVHCASTRLQQTEQPFRELHSNHTTQLLGHEVACSPQSSRRTAESDRPLKWCARPPSLSGCQQHRVWTVSSLYAATLERRLLQERAGKTDSWTETEREREKGEEDVCCVIHHHLQPRSSASSVQRSCEEVRAWGEKEIPHIHTNNQTSCAAVGLSLWATPLTHILSVGSIKTLIRKL